ncbi:sugar-binding domain-containing protein [Tissierella praeacuta]|uniref:sugar-binding transcriptional regulator n=1 Tax=Tissierella praeacuta TaxID=43131 RepID=UPI000DFC76F4|nr:sugar-binding domain-containing protein [Tissierella praeacuta]TCU75722.1 central glycolytic genes regulator [Tissierella praeacuta]SUP00309.1 Central glycolytic genes regulator [Tissierella praeacuta]
MEVLELFKKITPEIIEIIEKRYLILRSISYNQPIGRRALSGELGFKERTIRDEVGILKNQGLLNIDLMGMYITEEGKKVLGNLHSIYSSLKGIPKLEEKLQKLLKIKKMIIVPGDSAQNNMILKDMGKITSKVLKDNIKPKDIIGITGGSTMAVVADETTPDNKTRDIVVIPARGGLGREVETQSNSIAAKLGQQLGGSYRLLYVPDGLEEKALELMLKNEEIRESVELLNNMNTLIFGIGRADTMAKRRNLSDERIEELINDGAVSEALGHYFDIEGKEIWEFKTIGLSLEKFKSLDSVIGVAGGEEKAEAILSVSTLNKNMVLITDEAAARKILEIVNKATK